FAESEIADCRGMEHGVDGFATERFQFHAQIVRGGESLHLLRATFAGIRSLLTDEQGHLMSACREEIGQFRPQRPRGKIRQPARPIQRLVRWSRSHNTIHESETSVNRSKRTKNFGIS